LVFAGQVGGVFGFAHTCGRLGLAWLRLHLWRHTLERGRGWWKLDSGLFERRIDIKEKRYFFSVCLFKPESPLLHEINNLLDNLHKSQHFSRFTSWGICLLFRITIKTCIKSFVPICLWKGVAHLSIKKSSKPSDRNITLGSFVRIRFLIWKAAVLPLPESVSFEGLQVRCLVDLVHDLVIGLHVGLAEVVRS